MTLTSLVYTHEVRLRHSFAQNRSPTRPFSYLHVGGVVRDVHERGVHHLVVDGVLRGAAQATRARIEIVDEESAHLTLLDEVRRLTVTLRRREGSEVGMEP